MYILHESRLLQQSSKDSEYGGLKRLNEMNAWISVSV
jgi:hypothetical protein